MAGAGISALLFRLRWTGGLAIAAALAAGLHIASFHLPQTPQDAPDADMIVYTKNLGARLVEWSALIEDIEATGADVVVLQEVTQARMEELATLLPDHPFQYICNFSGWSAMAVASRWPVSEGGCTDHRSLAYAVVDAPSGAVWVASIHQVWPYPHEQAILLPDILDAIPAAPMRQVIAGDFNMVPWGASVRSIARAGGTRRISPALPTIEVRGVGLPIDHVLTDGQGSALRRDRMGSDHFGVVARINWEGP